MLKNCNIKRIKLPLKYRFIKKVKLSFLLNLALASAALILVKPPKAVMAKQVAITYCWFLEATERTTENRQTCNYEYMHWAGGGVVILYWENGEPIEIEWDNSPTSYANQVCGSDALIRTDDDEIKTCNPIRYFNPLTWEEFPRFYTGDTHYFYCVELPENLICWAEPDDYGKDYLFATNKTEENDTFSDSEIRHRFDDVKSFGLAQLLEHPDSVNEFKEMLDLVIKDERDGITIPNSSILNDFVAVKPGRNCVEAFCPDSDKLTYKEYLRGKIIAAKEIEKYQKMSVPYWSLDSYKKLLEQDTMYGNLPLEEIQNLENELNQEVEQKLEAYKQKARSFENLVNIFKEGFFQALDLALVGGIEFNLDAAPAIIRTYVSSKGINLSSIEPKSLPSKLRNLQRTEAAKQYFTVVNELLPKVLKTCLSENELSQCYIAVFEVTAKTTALWEDVERESASFGILPNSSKSVEVRQKLMDLINLKIELEILKIMDKFDEGFINQAIASETWDLLSLQIEILKNAAAIYDAGKNRWFSAIDNWHEIANSAKTAIFNANRAINATIIRNHYIKLNNNYSRIKIVNTELAIYLDKASEVWGNYLLNAHSSAVKQQPDGTVTTTFDRFVRPLE